MEDKIFYFKSNANHSVFQNTQSLLTIIYLERFLEKNLIWFTAALGPSCLWGQSCFSHLSPLGAVKWPPSC